ncbi:Undecaprenyl-phosphate galactose phosphotransferase, WbaP/exopolysaccharide biosynthesis polyprenyl glycosylphosphotransferase [Agromyces sp. CF514]|uniref:sugar transferase n=1 Tax=Agromyces sp. CF514 TaxID=1881031 RepID=UPI0008F27D06|nr:sugar transferase [Agromyces sp. CF514]SFR72363.1 Undecaprenyl-phosphate galactose phosphotransferase, WbaP/exopolysaccharide biosynthesis polyprenyl glycosylphosphotransferase [Agromyces sp. CF514]
MSSEAESITRLGMPGERLLERATAVGHRVVAQPRRLGWRHRLVFALSVTDAALVIGALLVAQLLRFQTTGLKASTPQSDLAYLTLTAAIAVGWLVALSATRSRMLRNIGTGMVEYQRVVNATFLTFGTLAAIAFLFQIDIARGYLAVAFPLGLVLLLLGRMAWRGVLHRMRRVGRCTTGAIIVGRPDDVMRVTEELRRQYRVGYRAIGAAYAGPARSAKRSSIDLPAVEFKDLAATSKRTRTRAVIIAGDLPGGNATIRRLGWDLENSNTELILVSRLTDVAGPRIHLRPISGLPMVHVDLPQYSGFAHAVKRIFDVVVTGGILLLLLPLIALIAMTVRLTSVGPVLFRQERVGVGGSRFTMLKFRSMVVDAEARLAGLQARNEADGVLFKVKDDPRITPIGRTLRRYSLDELPQLWNVLVGDMSLVGPRPPLPAEVDRYEEDVNRRLLTKPGITGLWQVSGRSNLSWDESVKIDLYYVENWSLTGDIVILLKTARAVVGSHGAY